MLKQEAYWEEIFSRYKASGLSQLGFCKQNNISHNQFQYRWYERNKALKAPSIKQFESVSVKSTPTAGEVVSTIIMTIHLPNQIRCELTVDLKGLSPLLTQLVQLC